MWCTHYLTSDNLSMKSFALWTMRSVMPTTSLEMRSHWYKQATLSGVAVIGAFSWSDTASTVWVAKMLWHWTLTLSIFALVSSAHQRLLRHLPSDKFQDFDDDKIKLALNLFLSPPVQTNASTRQPKRRASWRMIWIWQCPTMLMSYSWVLFLVGYGLHIMKPIFEPVRTNTSRKVCSRYRDMA